MSTIPTRRNNTQSATRKPSTLDCKLCATSSSICASHTYMWTTLHTNSQCCQIDVCFMRVNVFFLLQRCCVLPKDRNQKYTFRFEHCARCSPLWQKGIEKWVSLFWAHRHADTISLHHRCTRIYSECISAVNSHLPIRRNWLIYRLNKYINKIYKHIV